jgi:hypothetical protein
VPHPTRHGTTHASDDEDSEVDDVEVWLDDEDGGDAFGLVIEHDGDGGPQVRWLDVSADACCDGGDPDCCDGNGEDEVFLRKGNGKNRYTLRSGRNGDGGETRIEIVTPDGRTIHTERIQNGRVEVVRPDRDRVQALAQQLRERGRLGDDERRELVERAREQADAARGQADRAREHAERIAQRAREHAQRLRERDVESRRQPANPFLAPGDVPDRADRAPRAERRARGGASGAHDEALRDVHDLMREMRDEIEGLREELRDMRRELRGGQRDAFFGGRLDDDETIR